MRGLTLAEAGGMKAMKGESQCTAGSHVTGDAAQDYCGKCSLRPLARDARWPGETIGRTRWAREARRDALRQRAATEEAMRGRRLEVGDRNSGGGGGGGDDEEGADGQRSQPTQRERYRKKSKQADAKEEKLKSEKVKKRKRKKNDKQQMEQKQ